MREGPIAGLTRNHTALVVNLELTLSFSHKTRSQPVLRQMIFFLTPVSKVYINTLNFTMASPPCLNPELVEDPDSVVQ